MASDSDSGPADPGNSGPLPSRRRRAGRRIEADDSNWADLVGVNGAWSSDFGGDDAGPPPAPSAPAETGAPQRRERSGRRDAASGDAPEPPGSPAAVDPTRPWWAPSPGTRGADPAPRPAGPAGPPPLTGPIGGGTPPLWQTAPGSEDLFRRPTRPTRPEPTPPPTLTPPPAQVPVAPLPITERPAAPPEPTPPLPTRERPAAPPVGTGAGPLTPEPTPPLPTRGFSAAPDFTPPQAGRERPAAPPVGTGAGPLAPELRPPLLGRERPAAPPVGAGPGTPTPSLPSHEPPLSPSGAAEALPRRAPAAELTPPPGLPRADTDPGFRAAFRAASGSAEAPRPEPPRRRPSPYSNPPTGELFTDSIQRPSPPPADGRPSGSALPGALPGAFPGLGGPVVPAVPPPAMPPVLAAPPDETLTPFPMPEPPTGKRGRKGLRRGRPGQHGDTADPTPTPATPVKPLTAPPTPPAGSATAAGTGEDLEGTTVLPVTRRRRADDREQTRPKGRDKKRDDKRDKRAAVEPHRLDPPVPMEAGPTPAPAAVENPHGRAGRNLPAAIGVGAGLGGLALVSLFTRPEAFVALASLVVVLAVWELAGAMAAKQIVVPVVPLAVGSLGMLVSAYVAGEEGLLVSFGLTGFGVLLWRIIDGMEGAVRDVTAGLFTAAYVPLLAGFCLLLLADDDGPRRVVVFILVTVASDIGGYAAGVLAGRHPMAPTISPKKSWEGFAGSVVVCLVTGALSVTLLLDGRWWVGLVLGGAAVVTATLGDLSESLLKRDLGVKDMGSLLPGHGGIMDRLDSLLPTAPVAFLLLHLLVSS